MLFTSSVEVAIPASRNLASIGILAPACPPISDIISSKSFICEVRAFFCSSSVAPSARAAIPCFLNFSIASAFIPRTLAIVCGPASVSTVSSKAGSILSSMSSNAYPNEGLSLIIFARPSASAVLLSSSKSSLCAPDVKKESASN